MLHLKQAIWLSSDCFYMLAVLWLKSENTAVIMFIDISQIFLIHMALGIIFPGNSAKDIGNALKRQEFLDCFQKQ